MSFFDDYRDEMPTDEMDGFVAGVRAAATRMPQPSPTLAHLLTAGVSSEPKKRSTFMRVKAYVAGLGIAAKVALGAGVAAAAATAATVAPLEFSPAKEQSVTAGDDHHKDPPGGVVDKTTTTTLTPTTAKPVVEPEPEKPAPTTTQKPYVAPQPKVTTPTTTKPYVEPKPDKPTTTTTIKQPKPDTLHDITVSCEPHPEFAKVFCSWTATASPDHFYYKLVRSNADGSDWQKLYKSEDVREHWDTTPVDGHAYKYFVYSLREDGSIASESNVVLITCC